MPKVKVNDIEMYYEVHGEGSPLLMLHGFTASSQMWNQYIEDFQPHFQLIIPDLRGHGKTTNPSRQYTARQSSQDILALLDQLGIDRFNAIGVSSGGDILLHLSTKYPERVEKMVLDGTAHYFSKQLRQGYRDYTPTEENWGLFRQWHIYGDVQINLLIKQFHEMEHSYDDVNFTPSDLSRIKAETLIILGDRDKYISVDIAVEMYESIPDSYLWIVPNAGHAVTFTHAEKLKQDLLDFLSDKWSEP
jgi:pimeloyl-ACP methyl ester carboxylesterase